jgi:putative SOS response-associated peptidase YedK
MCGRFVMSASMEDYIQELDPQGELFTKVEVKPIKRYNVSTVTDVQVMKVEADCVQISPIHWG